MFDIGFWEVALIGIVTLLVVGPDRLPEVARTAGRWVLKARRFVAGVKSDFNRELQTGDLHKILGDQKEQINELRSMVNSTRRNLETSTTEAVAAAKDQLASVEELARGVTTPNKPSGSSTTSAAAATVLKSDADSSADKPADETGEEPRDEITGSAEAPVANEPTIRVQNTPASTQQESQASDATAASSAPDSSSSTDPSATRTDS